MIKRTLIGLLILAFAYTGFAIIANALWGETYTPWEAVHGNPAVSPSGKYALQTVVAKKPYSMTFDVSLVNAAVGPCLTVEERFSSNHRSVFVWDKYDGIWTYNSDIQEITYWAVDGDCSWVKRDFRETHESVPSEIWGHLGSGIQAELPKECWPSQP